MDGDVDAGCVYVLIELCGGKGEGDTERSSQRGKKKGRAQGVGP